MIAIFKREIMNYLKRPLFWVGVLLVIYGVFNATSPYLTTHYLTTGEKIINDQSNTSVEGEVYEGYIPATPEKHREVWHEKVKIKLTDVFGLTDSEAQNVIEKLESMNLKEAYAYLEQEQKELALLAEHKVNFIVLARYMQVISEQMINEYPNRIINIHHSFLPAFVGAKPYHAAFERGVKIIGATSHYVTTELDAGPIIEQDVVRITHKDTISELVNKGKDLEKIVLSRAVQKHIERKILAYKNKTVIFS